MLQPFVKEQVETYEEESVDSLAVWVTTEGGQARCHSSILQRFVQYWDTQGLDKRKMDHLLRRWAQAELVRQVGDADNSPTFRKGFVRGLPYIQTIWKRLCEGFARAATTAMEDIQVNLDDDIGLEHVLAANAGLLANSVRGLSPWAATALRAEQRLEFQVRCRPPPARARAATRTLWAAQLLARSFCTCAVTLRNFSEGPPGSMRGCGKKLHTGCFFDRYKHVRDILPRDEHGECLYYCALCALEVLN